MSETNFVPPIEDSDLAEGKIKAVWLKGKPIFLVRFGAEVYGVSNVCPHAGCAFQGRCPLDMKTESLDFPSLLSGS